MQNLQYFNEVDDYLLSVAASLLTPSQGIFAIRPFILPSSLLQLKLPFPFQPSPSTLSHQTESNNSINTSKIKNRYSIFLLQHLFQTLPGHICNPPLHPSSQLQLKLLLPAAHSYAQPCNLKK